MRNILATTRRTPRSLSRPQISLNNHAQSSTGGGRSASRLLSISSFTRDRWGIDPVPDGSETARGESWRRTSGANAESAKRFWTRALGNPFFSHIEREDVVHALKEIRNLPKGHRKRRASGDGKEGRISEETTNSHRIGVTTFLKIGRAARQVGDFLVELELADANPFDVCSWSTVQEARLRLQERPSDRHGWSKGVDSYLSSPIFRGDIQDAGRSAVLGAAPDAAQWAECRRSRPTHDLGSEVSRRRAGALHRSGHQDEGVPPGDPNLSAAAGSWPRRSVRVEAAPE